MSTTLCRMARLVVVAGAVVAVAAPGLRAEGLARFGPERGVRFERRVGEIV